MTLATRLVLGLFTAAILSGCTVETGGKTTDQPASQSASENGGDGANGGTSATPGEASPDGVVPAELVGEWSHGSGGASIAYTFAADGTYHESSGMSLGGSCSSTSVWDADGTVNFGDGIVTFERVSGTLTTETCSSTTEKPLAPETKTKSWTLDGGKLYTWDADCADYTTCGVDFERL